MKLSDEKRIENAYLLAKDAYRGIGVDVEKAVKVLSAIPISVQCWQGDDVKGFEPSNASTSGGGIECTGNYPGRARSPEELRADLDQALSFIPGKHRLNLHSIYAETGGKRVDRDKLIPEHFKAWITWAKARGMGIDFNPTLFAHPLADSGFTLSSPDAKVRKFWIRHTKACLKISEQIGKELKTPCIMNIWIPDGFKDIPVGRSGYRQRLKASLDEIFECPVDAKHVKVCLESKLFGIGSESCVIGSHEFYLGYAVANRKMLCMDTGHYHPTEAVSDKISATLSSVEELMLHISRPVRWDSDHVVILDDELRTLCAEIVRGGYLGRVHIGMDYFDGSINRIAAWTIGARSIQKALLLALLEPTAKLRSLEEKGDYTARLAMLEELKGMPFGAVWDYYCMAHKVPVGLDWFEELIDYENHVQMKRK